MPVQIASRVEVVGMIDFLFVGLTLVFFLLSWLYVRALERI
jgi:hypothetical protein